MKNILSSALLALVCAAAARAGVPTTLNYQGRLLDASGAPMEGPVAIAVAVFDAETDGTMVYTQEVGAVDAQNGLFSFAWGDTGLADALTNAQCWLQVHVNGAPLTPRQRLVAVPYAVDALRAETAAGLAGALPSLQLAPATAEVITNTPAPAGTLRLADDGSLYVNTNGTLEGWTTIAGGGRATSYGELTVYPLSIQVTGLVDQTITCGLVTTNTGLDAFDYGAQIAYDNGSGWLSVSPETKILGIGGSWTHDVMFDFAGLLPSVYAATITLNGNQYNGPQTVNVTATVYETATVTVDHDTAAEFNMGTMTDVEDVGGGSSPALRLVYNLPYGFGDGHDGVATISGDPNPRATCSGTSGTTTLTTSLSANPGDVVLVHQTRGSGVGNWHINRVVSDPGAFLNLEDTLPHTYGSGAQVLLVPQYSGLTITGGGPADWNGSIGGIYAVMCTGTVNVSGTLSADGRGFRGGPDSSGAGYAGEGTTVSYQSSTSKSPGGNSGGGCNNDQAGGGGGGNGSNGENDMLNRSNGGGTAGNSALSNMALGGGGGAWRENGSSHGRGADGGGAIVILGRNLTVSGSISAGGLTADQRGWGGGGAGAGGSILLKGETLALGSGVNANGGARSYCNYCWGGSGGNGRIRLEYGSGGYSGSVSPTPSATDLALKTSGAFRSPAIATANAYAYDTIHWTSSGGTQVRIRTRSASSEANLAAASWSDYLTASGSSIPSTPDEWFQYEVDLQGTSTDSPQLTRVWFEYEEIQ